jgi:toxin-antitoxin system PIN domain toxin
MRIQLPDVNVLIALHDATHQGHARAHQWFSSEGNLGWATCPLTENGFIRVFSQPALPNSVGSPAAAMTYLDDMRAAHGATHHFWPDSVSICDRRLFQPAAIAGHRQITDIYLLGLCQQNGGTLVTLDTAIRDAAIVSPHAELIRRL